jgi:hypothetical protein
LEFHSVDYSKLGFELSQEFGEANFDKPDSKNPLDLYPLVGGGEITNSYCGNFSGYYVCDRVALHELIGKKLGVDYKNKVFVRKVHFNCGKPSCPACYRYGSVMRETHRAVARLEATSKLLKVSSPASSEIEHIVVSISPKDYGITDEKVLRAKAVKALKELGIIGCVLIFHGSRHRRYKQIRGNVFRQIGTDWSPHFHTVGFIENGYGCRSCKRKSNCLAGCGGFDDRRWQYYLKTGIYVKVLGKRKTIRGTLSYQLNHASITKGAKRSHVVTWMGICSYRKLKMKVAKKKPICPICQYELKRSLYSGKHCFVTARDSYGYIRDSLEDYKEDGVVVWSEAPKRCFVPSSVGDKPRFGSMEWLRSVRKRSYGSYG